MIPFDAVDDKTKERILKTWKTMTEDDKNHFINQVAIMLSVIGNDQTGRDLVLDGIKKMIETETDTFADFGLFIDGLGELPKLKRASLIIEGYRIKNGLSSEPHHQLV